MNKKMGVNESENELLERLGRSCLWPWTFANPWNGREEQELCDALIIFGNDVIAISDKSSQFNTEIDRSTAWGRWWRPSIRKSCRQLKGALRLLENFPNDMFVDQKRTLFEIDVPNAASIRVHLVAVARGSREACIGAGIKRGSLRCVSGPIVEGNQFEVGSIWDGAFIHVIDDVSLDIMLGELDTIPDIIDYLIAREKFFRSGNHVVFGDENLLSFYLEGVNEQGDRVISLPDWVKPDGSVHIMDDFWPTFVSSVHYSNKKDDDVISYIWDKMIDIIWETMVDGDLSQRFIEHILRRMASQGRFSRRILMMAFIECLDAFRHGGGNVTVALSPQDKATAFVFVFGDTKIVDPEEASVWAVRFCKTAKSRVSQIGDVVCFYMVVNKTQVAEDVSFCIPAVAMIARDEWVEELRIDAEKVTSKYNLLPNLAKITMSSKVVKEYRGL